MSLPRGTIYGIGNKRRDPVLRSTEGVIPVGSPEAKAAIERVRRALQSGRAYVPRSFTQRKNGETQ